MGTELRCEECGQIADAEMKGWRALLGVTDDEYRGLTAHLFCPECAEREFGPPGKRLNAGTSKGAEPHGSVLALRGEPPAGG